MGSQGKQSKTPSKHSTPEAPHGKEPDRRQRGWFTQVKAAGRLGQASADNALADPQSLVLKGSGYCHLPVEI